MDRFPFLSLLKLDQPIVVALGELFEETHEGLTSWTHRHRALIPSADPAALINSLSAFAPRRDTLPHDSPLLGKRRDGRSWRMRRMLIAAFPESDHLRVEVVYKARGLPPLDEVSRTLWIQTPALATLTSPEATLTAHLKTWQLKEYAPRSDGGATLRVDRYARSVSWVEFEGVRRPA